MVGVRGWGLSAVGVARPGNLCAMIMITRQSSGSWCGDWFHGCHVSAVAALQGAADWLGQIFIPIPILCEFSNRI